MGATLGTKFESKTILSGVTGEVQIGRMMAIIGPSGAGKTTLLNMLRLKPGPGTAHGSLTINGARLALGGSSAETSRHC